MVQTGTLFRVRRAYFNFNFLLFRLRYVAKVDQISERSRVTRSTKIW